MSMVGLKKLAGVIAKYASCRVTVYKKRQDSHGNNAVHPANKNKSSVFLNADDADNADLRGFLFTLSAEIRVICVIRVLFPVNS